MRDLPIRQLKPMSSMIKSYPGLYFCPYLIIDLNNIPNLE